MFTFYCYIPGRNVCLCIMFGESNIRLLLFVLFCISPPFLLIPPCFQLTGINDYHLVPIALLGPLPGEMTVRM